MDGMASVYYSQADLSFMLGKDRHMVNVWRSRYSDFPEPDVEIGTIKKVPGWLPERLDEIVAWAEGHGFAIRPQEAKRGRT